MIFQLTEFLQSLAYIFGAILIFFKPIVTSIGQWMLGWITMAIDFLQQNFRSNLTIFVILCAILVVSGIIINVIWPGDRPGSVFSKGIEKIEELEIRTDISEEKDIMDEIRRCKDCGNPIGDAEVCSLCGARN